MRKLFAATVGALSVLAVAGAAGAKTLPWHGTMVVKYGDYPQLRIPGSGVATVNNTSGNTLNTLQVPGTNFGTAIVPITDPDSSIRSIRISAGTRPATFRDFKNPPLTLNQGAVYGTLRLCYFLPNCLYYRTLPLSQTAGAVGVGGLLTAGRLRYERFSLYAAPWTIGTATAVNQTRISGSFVTNSAFGLLHGPASATSSTAQPSGVVQLVSPTQVVRQTGTDTVLLSLYAVSVIHFIPEPGYLLLLGAGAAGLVALGRRRLRE